MSDNKVLQKQLDLLSQRGNKLKDYERLRFMQLHRPLIFNPTYRTLSDGAKITYAVLNDRHNLSVRNKWVDENGFIYFMYSDSKLAEVLGKGRTTILKHKKELEEHGLLINMNIQEGYANRLYLLEPEYTEEDIYIKQLEEEEKEVAKNRAKIIHKPEMAINADVDTPCHKNDTPVTNMTGTCHKNDTNKTNLNKTEYIKKHSINLKEKKNERMNTEEIKSSLLEKYDEDIVNKSLVELKKQIKNGNNIINTKNYLNALCENIKQQLEITKSATTINKNNNRFHNFKQRTDKYSEDDLERIAERKRNEAMKKYNS